MLTPEEQRRADRFRHELRREEFIFGRAMIRSLAAARLGTVPGAVAIQLVGRGKPRIISPSHSRMSFSISHSEGVLLAAMSEGVEIWVDIEVCAPADYLDIAELVFADDELEWLRDAPDDHDGRDRFLRIWTRKEAYLKAIGSGLTRETRSFSVAPTLRRASGHVSDGASVGRHSWKCYRVAIPDSNWHAALCAPLNCAGSHGFIARSFIYGFLPASPPSLNSLQ